MEETRQDTWQPNEPAYFFLEISRLILTVFLSFKEKIKKEIIRKKKSVR